MTRFAANLYYHVSPVENHEEIMRDGLRVSSGDHTGQPEGVYLFENPQVAKAYARGPSHVYAIDGSQLSPEVDTHLPEAVVHRGNIGPEAIRGYEEHIPNTGEDTWSDYISKVAGSGGWGEFSHLDSIVEQGRAQTRTDTPDGDYDGRSYGCHYIAPEIAHAIGGQHKSGIVLDPNGGYFDHHWAVHPDGRIVDGTYRKVISPNEPEYRNYVEYSQLGESADPEENPQGFKNWLQRRADAGGAGGWGGDSHPGQEPQTTLDLADSKPDDWMNKAGVEDYKFLYGNGQLHVSEDHDYDELASHANVPGDHAGPLAIGRVHVDMGKASFEVESNIHAQGLSRILKDYCDNVGWRWGGLTDLQGEPIGTGSEFAPVKSHYIQVGRNAGPVKIAKSRKAHFSYCAAVHVEGKKGFLVGHLDPTLFEGVKEWADDHGITLIGGNDNVLKRHEDLEIDNIYTPEWKNDDEHPMFSNEPDQREPSGQFRCPNCSQLFPSYRLYLQHRSEESATTEGDNHVDDGKFPELNMDATFPPNTSEPLHFYEGRRLAVDENAYRWDETLGKWLPNFAPKVKLTGPHTEDIDDFGWRRPVVYHPKSNTVGLGMPGDYHSDVTRAMGIPFSARGIHEGWVSIDPDDPEEVNHIPAQKGLRMRTGEEYLPQIQQALIPHEPQAAQLMETVGGYVDWDDDDNWMITGAANPQPKDLVQAPIPFLYDIQEDTITVGNPGQRSSDIPGKFTPGGMVEGTYEPGGKVIIRSATNMPFTCRHLLELWYYTHPHLEVKSVSMQDDAGKETKLARMTIAAERFWSKVIRGSQDDCWIWQAGSMPTGYGHFWFEGRTVKAHRFAYELERGDIPEGLVIDHLCFTKNCVNPYHMEVVTHVENSRRGPAIRFGTDKTHCPMNHEYTEENTYRSPKTGRRDCKECRRRRTREAGRRRRERERVTRQAGMDIGGFITAVVGADPAAFAASRALMKAGGKVFVVGGAVRDALLGKDPKDVDLMVTGLPPEEVDEVLRALPGKVDLTGKDFGVFRYNLNGDEVEVALPRRERSTGGGHKDFNVQADHTMTPEEDLYRRDFTANAMAVDLSSGKLLDPFHGLDDIKANRLRTLNTKSLSDDPLRTVRGLVAMSKHGLMPDKETKDQMSEHGHLITHLPQERVQAELDKLFKGDNPELALRTAIDAGVMPHIFPEVDKAIGHSQNNPHHELELGDHLLNVMSRAKQAKPDDPDFALAGLLHDIGKVDSHWTECRDCGWKAHGHAKPCPSCGSENTSGHFYQLEPGIGQHHEDVGAQQAYDRLMALKYPKDRAERVRDLIQHHMFPAFTTDKGARRFLNTVGDHADDLLHLRWADQGGKSEYPTDPSLSVDQQRNLVEQVRNSGQATNKSQLAINGNDVMQAGVPQGPQIGQVLQHLTEQVLENPELNTREGLLGLVRAWQG